MIRDVETHDAASVMRQHDQDEPHPPSESRDGEEIQRRGRSEVIREERLPRLKADARVPFQQRAE
jgi:hypothetical protein